MGKLQLYTNSFFDGLRQQMDEPADQAVRFLVTSPDWITEINSWNSIPENFPQGFPTELCTFFSFYLKKRNQVNSKQLISTQAFFEKRGDLYLAMLGFYALPYCYAFADGAQVLVRSKRIVDQIGERLGETASFVLDLFKPGAFIKEEGAYLTCAKVRLIHAFSRFFILSYSQDWKKEFGQPVNQEDMLGTNLAFSFIVLRGLTKMGFQPQESEYQDVLAYWKWVGELMGISMEPWPDNAKEAIELDRFIRKRHLKRSDAGVKLTQALIKYYSTNIPDPIVSGQVEPILSFFLGKDASQALDLPSKSNLSGDILGLLFSILGWINYGGKKGYQQIRQNLEQQQKAHFGRVLSIQLPELKRS